MRYNNSAMHIAHKQKSRSKAAKSRGIACYIFITLLAGWLAGWLQRNCNGENCNYSLGLWYEPRIEPRSSLRSRLAVTTPMLLLVALIVMTTTLMTNAIVVVAADALAVPALLLLCLLADLLLLKDIIILVAFGFFRFLIDDKEREKGERILVLFVARSDNIPMTFHT